MMVVFDTVGRGANILKHSMVEFRRRQGRMMSYV